MIIFFDFRLLIPDAIRNKYDYPYSCTAIPNNILYHCLPPINHAQTDRHSYAKNLPTTNKPLHMQRLIKIEI